jgi:hypothetical protein
MKQNEMNTRKEKHDDDVFFTPLEHIRNIENVIDKLETTRKEFQKVKEGMKLIDN